VEILKKAGVKRFKEDVISNNLIYNKLKLAKPNDLSHSTMEQACSSDGEALELRLNPLDECSVNPVPTDKTPTELNKSVIP